MSGKGLVYIVDDDDAVRDSLELLLSSAGFATRTFESARTFLAYPRAPERACLLSGGEVTVKVANDGRGGRNQQFALECAARIAGESMTVLSAGTDGIDGNSPAAGAVADGTTLARAQARGLDLRTALEKFDAYPLLSALGDAIQTGPTGNNLRDLRVLLAY